MAVGKFDEHEFKERSKKYRKSLEFIDEFIAAYAYVRKEADLTEPKKRSSVSSSTPIKENKFSDSNNRRSNTPPVGAAGSTPSPQPTYHRFSTPVVEHEVLKSALRWPTATLSPENNRNGSRSSSSSSRVNNSSVSPSSSSPGNGEKKLLFSEKRVHHWPHSDGGHVFHPRKWIPNNTFRAKERGIA